MLFFCLSILTAGSNNNNNWRRDALFLNITPFSPQEQSEDNSMNLRSQMNQSDWYQRQENEIKQETYEQGYHPPCLAQRDLNLDLQRGVYYGQSSSSQLLSPSREVTIDKIDLDDPLYASQFSPRQSTSFQSTYGSDLNSNRQIGYYQDSKDWQTPATAFCELSIDKIDPLEPIHSRNTTFSPQDCAQGNFEKPKYEYENQACALSGSNFSAYRRSTEEQTSPISPTSPLFPSFRHGFSDYNTQSSSSQESLSSYSGNVYSGNSTFVSPQDIQDAGTSSGMAFYDPGSENTSFSSSRMSAHGVHSSNQFFEMPSNVLKTGKSRKINKKFARMQISDQNLQSSNMNTASRQPVGISDTSETSIKLSLEYAGISIALDKFESVFREEVEKLPGSKTYVQKLDLVRKSLARNPKDRQKLEDLDQLTILRNILTNEIQIKMQDMIVFLAETQMSEDTRSKIAKYLNTFERYLFESLNASIAACDQRLTVFDPLQRRLHKQIFLILENPDAKNDWLDIVLAGIIRPFSDEMKKKGQN